MSTLMGRNILKGEYRVQILAMIRKNRIPSRNTFILLFPFFRLWVLMGTYFTLLPLLNTLNVMVGSRLEIPLSCFSLSFASGY